MMNGFYGDKLQHVATQLQFCKPVRLRLPRQLKLVIPPISVPLLTISGPLDRGIPFGAICALVLIGSLWFLSHLNEVPDGADCHQ